MKIENNMNFNYKEDTMKGLYERVYEAVRDSLVVDTINYRSIDCNSLFKTLIVSTIKDPNVTLDNVADKIRVYSAAFPECKLTVLFIHDVDYNGIIPVKVSGKTYLLIYWYLVDKFSDIAYHIYTMVSEILKYIEKGDNIYSSDYCQDLKRNSWTLYFKSYLDRYTSYEDMVPYINAMMIQYLAAPIITYHVLKVGYAVSEEDYRDFLIENAKYVGTIERRLIDVVIECSGSSIVGSLLDRANLLLSTKVILDSISQEDIEREISDDE